MRKRKVWLVLVVMALPMSLSAQIGTASGSGAVGIVVSPVRGSANDVDSYRLSLPVNEIELTFRAFDANGVPLPHLASSDLRLWDDGKRQRHIVMVDPYQNLPMRVGFVMDSSASVSARLNEDRAIIQLYASRLFDEGVDQGFLMEFDSLIAMHQNWTTNPRDLYASAKSDVRRPPGHLSLTWLYDSLYTACHDQWPHGRGSMTGNVILLFSDGEDDDSHTYLSEAVDVCQQKRVAIYSITFDHKSPFSNGQRNLEELASETGGRVFFAPKGEQLLEDLQIIYAEERNQYRLVYRPADFKADGRFHHVKLRCSVKGATITSRSGYYAIARP